MKNWIIALGLAVSISTLPACMDEKDNKSRADKEKVITADEVPAPVKSAFNAKYPGATDIIWEEASEDTVSTVKVKFKKDDKFWKAEFREDGTFVKDGED